MLRAAGATLCLHHLRQWLKRQDIDPPKLRPLAVPGTLDNPWAVRRSLRQVVRDVVDGRLSPEAARAAVGLARLLLIHTRRKPKRRTRKGPAAAGGAPRRNLMAR
jgi:hypothetical protein